MRIKQTFERLARALLGPEMPLERRLSREAILSIAIHSCFQLGASMSGLFLNLYLWRLTEDLVVNALYNLISFALTPVFFAIGGWVCKRKDRMVTYRLGIGMIALFYLMVVIAQEQVAQYYVWFAIFNGMASGLYWIGYLVLQYDVTTDVNRLRYLAINMVMFNLAGVAGPALAGIIIQYNEGLQGYTLTFIVAFIMFTLAAIISFRIPVISSTHKSYYLHLMGQVMKRSKKLVKGLYSFLILGLLQGIMLFLPNILLFRTVGREDWVGYLGMFFSALTVATGYLISRKTEKENVSKDMLFSATSIVFGSALLLFGVKFWTVLLFMMIFSVASPLMVNTLNSYYYRMIGSLPLKGQLRVESVVVRELFLNIGRVISLTLLILVAADIASIWLPIILFAMALCQYFLVLFTRDKNQEAADSHS